MENNTELIVINKKFDIIKKFIKNLLSQKGFWIVLFFLLTYTSIDFLNNEAYRDILKSDISLFDRLYYMALAAFIFIRPHKFICSILIFLFLYVTIKGITGKTKFSCFIISLFFELFGIINYIVMEARGVAISISDIYSIQTAMNVSKGIKIDFDIFFIVAILIFIIASLILFKHPIFKDNKRDKIKTKGIMVGVGVLGILCLFNSKPLMRKVDAWNVNHAYKYSGTGLTLMRFINDFKIEKPEGYNIENVEEILNGYIEDTLVSGDEMPNIVVVMNESFADLDEVFNIKLTEESLPYYQELIKGENIVSGVLHSSQFGGGTANVEYEFLTQNVTAFLPSGAMPYQQYLINDVKESIVSNLNQMEYTSYGIHSWKLSGYNRPKAYDFLQFDNIAFKENMPNLEFGSNEYSTDSSTYEYWFDIMNNKPENEKNFTFIVTVQNHFPYEKVDENDIQYSLDNHGLNSYMQFLNKSDDALKDLIEFIKNYDEDTILVFFGDHQPNLNLKENYGSNGNYLEEESNYIVPFFIWANYDIEEKSGIEISTNYLQSILYETIDMPLDQYTKYIIELREMIPVITSHYYIGKNGNRYKLDDESSPYYDKIKEYRNIVFYQIFDNK